MLLVFNMYFEQVKSKGDNFSYIISDIETREAAVIDPSYNADVIIQMLEDHNMKLKYVINTHGHSDHTLGNNVLVSKFNAKLVSQALSNLKKDVSVVDGETIVLGKVIMSIIHTPGHSADSICLLVDGKLLTGDTLFVGECGRTDMLGGSASQMYNSLFNKLMKLDDSIEVYPGHDYGPTPYSTIGIEKKTNYTLKKRTLEEFVEFLGQT